MDLNIMDWGHRFSLFAWVVCFSLLLLMAWSCATIKIPLEGKLGPYHLRTTVDSRFASYYVESYLPGKRTDPTLDRQLDALHAEFAGVVPQRETLKRIANEFSVDLAALIWAHHVLRTSENEILQERFLENLRSVQDGQKETPTDRIVVILAPGLDYKEAGHLTGADLRAQVEIFRQLGVLVHFVEVPPFGTVEENAGMIAHAIKRHRERSVVVAGPSSAGPAIHLALAKNLTREESQHVAAWLNLGGVINGSAVIDWVDSGLTYPIWRTVLWARDWNYEAFRSLRTDVSRKRAAALQLPPHIKVVNYIGLSLSGNISRFGKDGYRIMCSEGPNDGLALLPDMIVPNSRTIIAPTSDHFFAEDPMIKEKSIALLKTMVEML